MEYKVVVTADAESDLSDHLLYLVFVKKNSQAAHNVNEDFLNTIRRLSIVADSLQIDEELSTESVIYRRIHFAKHNYYMVYRVVEDTIYVDKIFHDVQDKRLL